MIQGCTAVHTFTVPFHAIDMDNLSVTYKQNDIFVKKSKDDCTLDGNFISVILTPEDTVKFNCNEIVKCQIKIKSNNVTKASGIIHMMVGEILDKEAL